MEQRGDVIVHALETNFVTLQTLEGFFEETFSTRGLSRHVVLLPFNRGIYMFEDLLDRVGDFFSDTISGNEGHLE